MLFDLSEFSFPAELQYGDGRRTLPMAVQDTLGFFFSYELGEANYARPVSKVAGRIFFPKL